MALSLLGLAASDYVLNFEPHKLTYKITIEVSWLVGRSVGQSPNTNRYTCKISRIIGDFTYSSKSMEGRN